MKSYSLYFRNKYWGFKKVYTGGYTYIGGHKRKDRNYWANWEMRMIPIRSDIRNVSISRKLSFIYSGEFIGIFGVCLFIGFLFLTVYLCLI
jgi:formate-dependent phosphoribosylglycinamide formyltransferase (GAR transformylase)